MDGNKNPIENKHDDTSLGVDKKQLKFGLNVTSAGAKKRKVISALAPQTADQGHEITAIGEDGQLVHADNSLNKPAAPLVIPLNDDSALERAAVQALQADANGTVLAVSADGEEGPVIPLLLQQSMRRATLGGKMNAANEHSGANSDAAAGPLDPSTVMAAEHGKTETQRYREDLESRPENPSLESYERVPVEMIGEAMLRGMGWKPGAPVGLTNKQVVEPFDLVKRPGRLGLGAKLDDAIMPTHDKLKRRGGPSSSGDSKRRRLKPGERAEQQGAVLGLAQADGTLRARRGLNESLVDLRRVGILETGAPVYIAGGRHKGLFGRVLDGPPGSAGRQPDPLFACSVRLARSGETVQVRVKRLQVISEDQLARESLEEAAAGTGAQPMEHDDAEAATAAHAAASPGGSMANDDDQKKSKKKAKKKDKKAKSLGDGPVRRWVRPDLTVRVVSKRFRDGQCYEKKVRIVDVVAGTECTVELSDGRVADGAMQDMLETVIPGPGGRVVVVRPGHARYDQQGTVVEKNNKRSRCVVQWADDMVVETMDYDDVCQIN